MNAHLTIVMMKRGHFLMKLFKMTYSSYPQITEKKKTKFYATQYGHFCGQAVEDFIIT